MLISLVMGRGQAKEGANMKNRLSSSLGKESGFTLVEMAVGLAVAMFLLVSTIQFLTHSFGIITRLNIQRDIRDQGLMAVETIEREFRKVLEYGGSFTIAAGVDSDVLTASFGGREVSIKKDGDEIKLVIDTGTETTSTFPGSGLVCGSFAVKALVGDFYVPSSDPDAKDARVIVIEFELEDDNHAISRSFKAAFSSVNATGS